MAAIIVALVGQYMHIKGKDVTVSGTLTRTGDVFQVWSNPAAGTSFGLRFELKGIATVTVGETIIVSLK